MDVTLFNSRGGDFHSPIDVAWSAIQPVIDQGGLVSLLWHNNYFDEPEYREWHETYRMLLVRLARLRPWCAPGAEIAKCGPNEIGLTNLSQRSHRSTIRRH
jgi:hypothetical protein